MSTKNFIIIIIMNHAVVFLEGTLGLSAIHVTLKMEDAWPSKTMITYHIPTRGHISQDHNKNLHRRENLKYRTVIFTFITNCMVENPY
jgi:hypothetical protein